MSNLIINPRLLNLSTGIAESIIYTKLHCSCTKAFGTVYSNLVHVNLVMDFKFFSFIISENIII